MDNGSTEDEQAIALTEISWERSMRNEDNPRVHEDVTRTETSITRTMRKSTQQRNPLFNDLEGGSGQGGEGAITPALSQDIQIEGGGENNKSPPKLNPIYLDNIEEPGAEEKIIGENQKRVHFNVLATNEEDPSTGKQGDGTTTGFSMRTTARKLVYSVPFQVFVVFLIIFDGALLITEILVDRGDTSDDKKLRVHRAVDICTALIIC